MFRPYLLFLAAALPFSAYAQDRVFAEGSEWEVVSEGHEFAEGMAWDTEGHFFFTDVPQATVQDRCKDRRKNALRWRHR